ncbi:hypothetical protein N1851_026962 [Merluccius polli]|uniref:CCHC-type domain-containing protein n=1 Tax=Merluccius polli TaxID=89951 RepID=A0AA47MB83_MERPO|nr:hypothetical protein N1851_026962 [Merluccius polli]
MEATPPAQRHPAETSDARVKLRLARLQMEREEKKEQREFQRELELRKLDLEAEAIKLRQLELQKALASSTVSMPPIPAPTITFDVNKNISLVPIFRESKVKSYFGAFERIASALRWPKDVWAILLQCKLTGKALSRLGNDSCMDSKARLDTARMKDNAQEAYASLSVDDSLVYDKLKGAILCVYELVPEAYRQRFRSLRKVSGQTFYDFACEKELLFDRWCMACKADDLTSVRKLILLEELKACLPERTVVYLNEQMVTTLSHAASLADEFALTHKAVFAKRDSVPVDSGQRPVDSHVTPAHAPMPRPKADRQCFFCHKPGHLMAECVKLKQKQQPVFSRGPKGVGLIKTVNRAQVPQLLTATEPDECFKPFVSQGFVSLTGRVDDQVPVTILRDTGGSQSFILASALSLCKESACDVSTVVRGIGMSFVPAPLHRIHVQSRLVTGFCSVAVLPSFPIEGVSFIMGNDIAGGKVYPTPEVVDIPIPTSGSDILAREHPDMFRVSVLTRAQARKQGQGVDLSDSLFASVFAEDKLPPAADAGNVRLVCLRW